MSAQVRPQHHAMMRRMLTSSVGNGNRPVSIFTCRQNFLPRSSSQTLHHPHIQRQRQKFPGTYAVSNGSRSFVSSPILNKKKDKSKKSTESDIDTNSSKVDAPTTDPFDLSQLHSGIADAIDRLKDDLSKLRAGGRFNPEAIENLRVHVTKGAKETVKLGELAQVVPKGGRMITVLVGEEDHVKPTNSTIIASNLSLTPQQDPHNPLQLNIPIPPPTKESRDQTVQIAKTAMEKAANTVRNARGAVHKRLQDMQKKKLARPDDIRKAHDQMEKLAEKGQKEVKDTFEAAKIALE